MKAMKRFLAFLLCGLAFAPLARGASSVYNNINGVTSPPQAMPVINATNFFNNNIFDITVSSGYFYDFTSVERFTNRNEMVIYPGVRFDTVPEDDGQRHRAKYFVNANNVNGAFNNTLINGYRYLLVDATNIINRGNLFVNNGYMAAVSSNALTHYYGGTLSLQGDNVDASRGLLTIGTFGMGAFIRDDYWGFGTNEFNPGTYLQPASPVVPSFDAFFPSGGLATVNFSVAGTGLQAFYRQNHPSGATNQSLTIIFVRTPDPALSVSAYVDGTDPTQLGDVYVVWGLTSTNPAGQVVQNYLTLSDTFGSAPTNALLIDVVSAGFYYADTGRRRPANFGLTLATYPDASGTVAVPYTSMLAASVFNTNSAVYETVTNQSVFLGATVMTTEGDPEEGSPQLTFAENVRSLPGRIELKADKSLSLNQAHIQASSYTLVSGTNSFVGATNAAISTPYADLRLGSTNGALLATGTVLPKSRKISGYLNIYAMNWQNQILVSTNVGNSLFHVLFVDAQLTAETATKLLDLDLRSYYGTNKADKGDITIGDTFNVIGTFYLDAATLTVTNGGGIILDLENPDDGDWASNVPYLQSLTNNGSIISTNGLHFYGRSLAPDGSDLPYTNFINGGTVRGSAVVINAQNLDNHGGIWSILGGTFIQAGTVTISYVAPSPGYFWASNADLSITCLDFNATNQTLLPTILAGRSVSLAVSNSLNILDNSWSVGDGFNLWVKPATGDFNRVTVTNNAAIFANVYNTWAGEDRGSSTAGFTNNAAIGRLILNGSTDSAFTFTDLSDGDGITNALYVDVLVLQGNATNLDAGGNLANIYVTPEMKLYYSHAYFGTTEVTAGLSTKTVGGGGGFTQLSHVGAINTASNPGSGGGGSVSEVDLGLNVQIVDSTAVISWNTVAGAVNNVYFKSETSEEWELLTSFVSGASGPTSLEDPLGPEMRVYRVRVDLPAQ